MFGRGRKNKNGAAPGVVIAADDMPRPAGGAGRNEKTVIGENIVVEGHFRGRQDLVVEGAVRGIVDIRPHDLEVGPRGWVEAEIRAQNVRIHGRLRGSVDALEKVIIARQADFFGNIKTRSISVEDGARFKGVIELERKSHGKFALMDSHKKPITTDVGNQPPTPLPAAKKEK